MKRFHRAADRAMDHHRHPSGAVGVDVEGAEPFGRLKSTCVVPRTAIRGRSRRAGCSNFGP